MNASVRLVALGSLLAGSTALSAHHTISTFYDVTRQVTLRGVVDSAEWKSPHSFVELGVSDANGGVAPWRIETQASYVLRQKHLEIEKAFTPGQMVTVIVCIAKDGGPKGWLRSVTTFEGVTLDLSNAGGC